MNRAAFRIAFLALLSACAHEKGSRAPLARHYQENIIIPPPVISGTLTRIADASATCPAGYIAGSFILLPLPLTPGTAPVSAEYLGQPSDRAVAGYCKASDAYVYSISGDTMFVPPEQLIRKVCRTVSFIEQSSADETCQARKEAAAEYALLAKKLDAAQGRIDSLASDGATTSAQLAATQRAVDTLRGCVNKKTTCKGR